MCIYIYIDIYTYIRTRHATAGVGGGGRAGRGSPTLKKRRRSCVNDGLLHPWPWPLPASQFCWASNRGMRERMNGKGRGEPVSFISPNEGIRIRSGEE
jgi:hypothetical protein